MEGEKIFLRRRGENGNSNATAATGAAGAASKRLFPSFVSSSTDTHSSDWSTIVVAPYLPSQGRELGKISRLSSPPSLPRFSWQQPQIWEIGLCGKEEAIKSLSRSRTHSSNPHQIGFPPPPVLPLFRTYPYLHLLVEEGGGWRKRLELVLLLDIFAYWMAEKREGKRLKKVGPFHRSRLHFAPPLRWMQKRLSAQLETKKGWRKVLIAFSRPLEQDGMQQNIE